METTRKHSKKRDAILECICATKSHPSAEWVYQQLKPQIPDLSLGTVYRNIAMFKADRTIQSIGTVAGLERYDGNTDPHTHFICTDCGRVIDLELVALPQATLKEAECTAGGTITSYQLQFFGCCADCAKKKN
ncbi:MAG: transcriptional repressor [Oscillospiraceae bacterium]|nr:transcriptional repressor [Oscillospiraceae bacterium]